MCIRDSYLVNNLAGQIPNADADIRLLHDELLSAAAGEDPFMKVLQQLSLIHILPAPTIRMFKADPPFQKREGTR